MADGKSKGAAGKTVTVTQTGSPIGRPKDQRETLIGLGLNKRHRNPHAGGHAGGPRDDREGQAPGARRRGFLTRRSLPARRGSDRTRRGRRRRFPGRVSTGTGPRWGRLLFKRVEIMKLNELRDNPGARKARMRIGRGIGSGKGKTGGPRRQGPDQPVGRRHQRLRRRPDARSTGCLALSAGLQTNAGFRPPNTSWFNCRATPEGRSRPAASMPWQPRRCRGAGRGRPLCAGQCADSPALQRARFKDKVYADRDDGRRHARRSRAVEKAGWVGQPDRRPRRRPRWAEAGVSVRHDAGPLFRGPSLSACDASGG